MSASQELLRSVYRKPRLCATSVAGFVNAGAVCCDPTPKSTQRQFILVRVLCTSTLCSVLGGWPRVGEALGGTLRDAQIRLRLKAFDKVQLRTYAERDRALPNKAFPLLMTTGASLPWPSRFERVGNLLPRAGGAPVAYHIGRCRLCDCYPLHLRSTIHQLHPPNNSNLDRPNVIATRAVCSEGSERFPPNWF